MCSAYPESGMLWGWGLERSWNTIGTCLEHVGPHLGIEYWRNARVFNMIISSKRDVIQLKNLESETRLPLDHHNITFLPIN